MIGLLRALRKLILGETWIVPLGVAVTVGAAALAIEALGSWFETAGGFVVLAGALATLVLAVRS